MSRVWGVGACVASVQGQARRELARLSLVPVLETSACIAYLVLCPAGSLPPCCAPGHLRSLPIDPEVETSPRFAFPYMHAAHMYGRRIELAPALVTFDRRLPRLLHASRSWSVIYLGTCLMYVCKDFKVHPLLVHAE